MLKRQGVTLIEVVVTVVILAVIAGVVYLNEASASKLGGAAANVDQTARMLSEIADAVSRVTGTGGVTSFNQGVGQENATVSANAGRLSQLTTKITTSSRNSCGYTYTSSEVGRWSLPFYYRIFTTDGFKFAPGYIAQDSMIRFNASGVATTVVNRPSANDAFSYGTLAVVMPGTLLADAEAMAARVEGDQTGLGAVRFTRNGTDTVTLQYHFTIRGC